MLEILNAKWDRVIIVCSYSVFDFNYPIEKDWYGVEWSPMLKKTGRFYQSSLRC